MPTITLTIDHLPYKQLSPNARVHWTTKNNYTQAAKTEACMIAKQSMNGWKAPDQAVISYTFTVTSRRNRDIDNLVAACKAVQDGLVEAGVIKADDCWHLSLGQVQVVKGDKPKTEIIVEGN